MSLRETILKWALKNAVDHDGKAMEGPILSRVLAVNPELKKSIDELIREIRSVVIEVNSMAQDLQIKLLEEMAPALLISEGRKKEEKVLPPLPQAERYRVSTRLPPEPSGYMHIGHGMSGLLNYLYARMYDGKVWLRFEDTNPLKAKLEYYESFKKGYRWLGIEWDYEKNNSDDMELYYEYAVRLIRKGYAYVCRCGLGEMRRRRRLGIPCKHLDNPQNINLGEWSEMLNGGIPMGGASLRLKGDLTSQNTAMRDPVLFRIVEHPHPIHGKRYRVWPTYDMAVSIQDGICGITHVFRTDEFAFRDELQNYVRGLLNMDNPVFIEYSRFGFKGTPLSKRILRGLIEKGLIKGWDDPRLPTIEAVKRRGIHPEAIKEFTIMQTGITRSEREYDWSLLYAVNRRILDPVARRLFFVPNPVKLVVENAPPLEVEIPYHPSIMMGSRKISTDKSFYISSADALKMVPGNVWRLKHLFNFKVEGSKDGGIVRASYVGRELSKAVPIIQWVTEEYVEVEVDVPDIIFKHGDVFNQNSLETIRGYGELSCLDVNKGENIQFERFGFCIRDREDRLAFIYTHS